MPMDDGTQSGIKTLGAMVTTAQAVTGVNFALNLAIGASLSELFGMLNAQQLFILLPLCKVVLPTNAAKFFS